MRISDWSSDVCSSDLLLDQAAKADAALGRRRRRQDLARALEQVEAVGQRGEHQGGGAAEHHQRGHDDGETSALEIGRASCRERVGQYVSISGVAVTLKKKNMKVNLSLRAC